MSFDVDIKRFLLVYPVLLLLLSASQLFFHRIYMLPYYNQLGAIFYAGAEINFLLLVLSAALHAFLFQLVYVICQAQFPKLKGGLVFGLLLALLLFLPQTLFQMAAVSQGALRPVLGLWLYFQLVANLMLGAVLGVAYSSSDVTQPVPPPEKRS